MILAGDGGNKARLTRESTKETVKTIRAGKAGHVRRTCGDYARVLYFILHARLRARRAPGFPCALYL
jgi:hypothetical protein